LGGQTVGCNRPPGLCVLARRRGGGTRVGTRKRLAAKIGPACGSSRMDRRQVRSQACSKSAGESACRQGQFTLIADNRRERQPAEASPPPLRPRRAEPLTRRSALRFRRSRALGRSATGRSIPAPGLQGRSFLKRTGPGVTLRPGHRHMCLTYTWRHMPDIAIPRRVRSRHQDETGAHWHVGGPPPFEAFSSSRPILLASCVSGPPARPTS